MSLIKQHLYNQQMRIDYLAIAFGPSDTPGLYWNHKFWADGDKYAAIKFGREQLSRPGTFGYVVIEENEDSWEIVDELGAPENAVSVGAHGYTYFVQPAKKLQLI